MPAGVPGTVPRSRATTVPGPAFGLQLEPPGPRDRWPPRCAPPCPIYAPAKCRSPNAHLDCARTPSASVGSEPVSYTHLTLPTICSV
eukprot:1424710-Alexandrium_andersonii.AAC.1